jgi:hypothetical protein
LEHANLVLRERAIVRPLPSVFNNTETSNRGSVIPVTNDSPLPISGE